MADGYAGASVEDAPKSQSGIFVILAIQMFGLVTSTLLFGLNLWITVLWSLIVAATLLRGWGASTAMLATSVHLGIAFATFLYGFPTWPSALLGIGAIMVIGTFMTSSQGTDTQGGDANPILYIALIVAIRAWTAFYYTTNDAITFTSTPGILSWLALFVLGVSPDLPILVNTLLFIVLNGTLALYLVLMLKRIANPAAN